MSRDHLIIYIYLLLSLASWHHLCFAMILILPVSRFIVKFCGIAAQLIEPLDLLRSVSILQKSIMFSLHKYSCRRRARTCESQSMETFMKELPQKDVILSYYYIIGVIGSAGGTDSVIEYAGSVFRDKHNEC